MEKQIKMVITGETGSGKTYEAIEMSRRLGEFIYIAPCRQLVYESYMAYYQPGDSLATGEVKINGNTSKFAVYESAHEEDLKKYKTIIVDEGHFIGDDSRGAHLQNLLVHADEEGLNILIVTATPSFEELDGFNEIHLESKFRVPEKIKVSGADFFQNILDGLQTIVFSSSINNCRTRAWELANDPEIKERGIVVECIHSGLLPSERLQIQLAFARKEINVIVSTNVLAQGLNFTCENMYIEEEYFNTPEVLQQKLGRLGRPFKSNREEVYYCSEERMDVAVQKRKINIKKRNVYRNHIDDALFNLNWNIEHDEHIEYNGIKYIIPETVRMCKRMEREGYANRKQQHRMRRAVGMIVNEMQDIRSIIVSNRGRI